jgi:hypothetical protein
MEREMETKRRFPLLQHGLRTEKDSQKRGAGRGPSRAWAICYETARLAGPDLEVMAGSVVRAMPGKTGLVGRWRWRSCDGRNWYKPVSVAGVKDIRSGMRSRI